MKLDLLFFLALILSLQVQSQTTYHVGEGQTYDSIGAVPLELLVAGDSILIHWRAQPYKEKWVIAVQGTEQQPIVFHGVPNGSGDLPVIDAIDATTRSQINFWSEGRGVIKVGGANTPSFTPQYIVIENLEIKNGRDDYTFTGRNGLTDYEQNCAAIFIESGSFITIRNCILTNCANGLFCAHVAEDILIEHCYIYGNGNVGRIYEHNNYTEARRITFQYNHFGPLCVGCPGNNLKDRSAGTVIRYNWIEGGNRQLDLVNADGTDLYTYPEYSDTWVYGNVIVEPGDDGNSQIVHYGGDVGSVDSYRKGTLHFFNNTVVSSRTANTTLFRLSTNEETADCFNNILYVTETGNRLALIDGAGTVNLFNNWYKTNLQNTHGTLTGIINNLGNNIEGTDPGFENESSQDFHLAVSSSCRDSAYKTLPAGINLEYQYVKHQSFEPRPEYGFPDLGAFEYFDITNQTPIVHTGNDTSIYLPVSSVILTASATDPDGTISSHSWSLKRGPSSVHFTLDNSFNYIASGLSMEGIYVFEFMAIDNLGGSGSDSLVIIVNPDTTTLPAEISNDNIELVLYPNPANNKAVIVNTFLFTDIQILNYTGQIVGTRRINCQNEVEINLTDYKKGIYLVKIFNTKQFVTIPLVIQ